MKGLLRRAAAALLASACLASLSACSAAQDEAQENGPSIVTEGTPADEYMADVVKQTAVQMLSLSEEQLMVQKAVFAESEDTVTADMVKALLDAKRDLGALKEIDYGASQVNVVEDGTYTAMIPLTFEEGEMLYVMNVDPQTGQMAVAFTSAASEDDANTTSEKMATGGVYSAIGIGTVFGVLIFISLIIACFKFIHQWEESKNANHAPSPASAPSPAPKAAPVPVPAPAPAAAAEENLMDDTELLLLITTAIAAYEGTPSNGLKVRSIRRAPGAKWKRS